MTVASGRALYTPEILSLAMSLADYPISDDLVLRAEASSRVCGSRIVLAAATDERGRIARVGAKVTACAIGQAASALFLAGCGGLDKPGSDEALRQIESWLSGATGSPDWPGIAVLEPARDYPSRHGAILLPWKAAVAALSNEAASD